MPMWFQNLTIRAKVTLSFAVICLTTIALGVFAIQRMGAMNDNLIDLQTNWLPSVKVLGSVAQQTERVRGNVFLFAIADDDRQRAQAQALLTDTLATAQKQMAVYEPLITEGKERELAKDFKQKWERLLATGDGVLDLSRKGDRAGALVQLFGPLREQGIEFRAALNADIEFNNRSADAAADAGTAT